MTGVDTWWKRLMAWFGRRRCDLDEKERHLLRKWDLLAQEQALDRLQAQHEDRIKRLGEAIDEP